VGSTTIGVLGPLVVDGHSGPLAPRDRVVLSALALRPGEEVSLERLADALWGDRVPDSWRKVLAGCVMRLRRVLGTDAIETVPDGYRLAVPGDSVDARRFERLVIRAHELLTLGEPERASHMVGEALDLWRGRALGDLEGWDAGRIEVTRLDELRRDAEELHLDAALRAGRCRDVLGEAQARVGEAPLRERRWALLATGQYQAGHQADALRTLHRARTVLAEQLGIDPGPELVELERSILCQDPSLMVGEPGPEPTTTCPYPGLVAYDVGDAEAFFGRDGEVIECLRRLTAVGVLAVVGPSGSGKSSLVRAGIAAALVREDRRMEIVTPGSRPMAALPAVRSTGSHPVLIVDQCEQAVSLCADTWEREAFFAALAAWGERAPVVVTMRADRLGDATAHATFARLIERGLYLLGPMSEPDLRMAIEGPARRAGLLLEPGLVDLLVREVEGEPGALPLLSHALRQTWQLREGRTLTVAGYQATGGINGALARTAEEVYERVPSDRRGELRDLLLRLVDSTIDGDPVSSPVARHSLVTDPEEDQLVDLLVDARLVTSDEGVIELSHEALARAWPRLRGWLDDDAEGQRVLRHLAVAAGAWDSMGRPDAELYRGARLRSALEWRAAASPRLTATEQEFLDDARRQADVAARREHRARRRRRGVSTTVAVLLVVALVAGLLAVGQADRARTASVAADVRRASALARDADGVDQALLLAAEAVGLEDSAESRSVLLDTLTGSPSLIGAYRHEGSPPAQPSTPLLAMIPQRSELISSDGWSATVLDAGTLEVVRVLDSPPAVAAVSPDGTQVVVGVHALGPAGPLRLLDAATFEPQAAQLGGVAYGAPIGSWDVEYSADGRALVAHLCVMRDWLVWDFSCSATVWDLAAPHHPVTSIATGRSWGAELSNDGSRLYVGSYAGSLDLYDLGTGERTQSIPLTPDLATNTPGGQQTGDTLELSPDGATVTVRDHDDVVLLDGVTLVERARMPGQGSLVFVVQFSPDGQRLATGAEDGTVTVRDVGTGEVVERLTDHTAAVHGLAFDGAGDTLYAVAEDRLTLAWDLRGDRGLLREVVTDPTPAPTESLGLYPRLMLPAPDSEAVAILTSSATRSLGTLRFFDVASGGIGDTIDTAASGLAWFWMPPAFDLFVVGEEGGAVTAMNVHDGTVVARGQVSQSRIVAVASSPDGQELVAIDGDARLFRLDATTLAPIAPPIPLGADPADGAGGILSILIGADGRTAVAMLAASTVVIDLQEGRVLRRLDLGLEPARFDISPDGDRLAVLSSGGAAGLLALDTGEWIKGPSVAHRGMGLTATWRPDGAMYATSATDGVVRLWDGPTGDPLATVDLPGQHLGAVARFRTDGYTLGIGTLGASVLAWDTRPEALIERACAIAGRALTPDEWGTAFGDRPYRPVCAGTSR
jgi:DNA-binding SARP family transcriptional activator/WD40 repeat protein